MDFYAEISRKQLSLIESGDLEFCLPDGVTMKWKSGSRACYFTCDSKEDSKELMDGLDASNVNWQESYENS